MLVCSATHLRGMVHSLRQLPEDKWDWTPDVAAPTARILAAHAYQWLVCDRQHIAEPDAFRHHPVPDAPADPQAMCAVWLSDRVKRTHSSDNAEN